MVEKAIATEVGENSVDSSPASTVAAELERVGLSARPTPDVAVDLSMIVPAYNEQRRLARTLAEAWEYLQGRFTSYEIVVVDDGSTDETASLVQQFHRLNPSIRLLKAGKNRGKGAAVRLGMSNARGALVMYADADGASRMEHLARLLEAVDEGADVAIGSRAAYSPDVRIRRLPHRHVIGRIFNFIVSTLAPTGIRDTQCGFKLFRAEAAHRIFPQQAIDGYAFDVELLLLARRLDLKIAETPIDWTHMAGSKVNVLRDSIVMLRDVFRIAWIHRMLPAQKPSARPPTHGPRTQPMHP